MTLTSEAIEKMNTANWTQKLVALDACEEAIRWCHNYPDLPSAWDACDNTNWLFWLAGRTGASRKSLVMAACACARTALIYVPAGEERPRLAIEAAEAWCESQNSTAAARAARAARAVVDVANAALAAALAARAARAADRAARAAAAYAARAAATVAADATVAAAAADATVAADAAAAAAAAARAADINLAPLVKQHLTCPTM